MCKIAFFIPGNTMHSDVSPDAWQRLWDCQWCIPVLKNAGIPISMSFQAVDFDILPWLKDVLDTSPNIELVSAPFSHALTPMFNNKQHRDWEIQHGVKGSNVTFFPEFCPDVSVCSTDHFLVLGPQTYAYSFDGSRIIPGENPESDYAFYIGDKVGLVLRDFEKVLSALYTFFRDPRPSSGHLDSLMGILHDLVKTDQPACIIPIDAEAPFVGSVLGATAWKMFFERVKAEGLSGQFISLTEAAQELRPYAEKASPRKRLDRTTTKWTGEFYQLQYAAPLLGLNPRKMLDHQFLSMALCSDSLSALMRYISHQKKEKRITWDTYDLHGNMHTIGIEPNPDLVSVFQVFKEMALEGRKRKAILDRGITIYRDGGTGGIALNIDNPLVMRLIHVTRGWMEL